MVPGIDIEQFSSNFQSFLGLTPLARVAFLEILHQVDDDKWSGEFAAAELQSMFDIAIKMQGEDTAEYYFELVKRILRKINEKYDTILDICNSNNLYYYLDNTTFFRAADEIVTYIRGQIFLSNSGELNKIISHLSEI